MARKKLTGGGWAGTFLNAPRGDGRVLKSMKINDLESIAILGLGLLGGSLGLALERVFPRVKRHGYSHRQSTRAKALEAGTVDEVFASAAEAAGRADLVILASPISIFPDLLREIAPVLAPGSVVTDVGSTKRLPVKWAGEILPKTLEFIGSHPMAGSEQRGVEFARGDLFDNAQCIITPVAASTKDTREFINAFWGKLGMHVSVMSPAQHDRTVARISHLPHVLAAALVNCSDAKEMLLCGKGFLDTTRIASGPPEIWHDILSTNAANVNQAIGKLIKELAAMQAALRDGRDGAITRKLQQAQTKRNELVAKKLSRKELPT